MADRVGLSHEQRVLIASNNLQNAALYLRKLGITWGHILGMIELMSEGIMVDKEGEDDGFSK